MKSRYVRMLKKQKGFTLIELLAVILILGIIALIAIPSVNSVIEQSKKGAIEQSVIAISKAAEDKCVLDLNRDNKHYTISDGNVSPDLPLKNLPDSGEITVDKSCGVKAVACDSSYCAHFDNSSDKVKVVKNKGDNNTLASYIDATDPSCFIFDESSRTITGYHYDNESCPMKIKIPATINKIPVEYIGEGAFTILPDYDYAFVRGVSYNDPDVVTFTNGNISVSNFYKNSNDYVLKSLYDYSYDDYYVYYYKVLNSEKFYKYCTSSAGTKVNVDLSYVHTNNDGYSSCSLSTYYNGSYTATEVKPTGNIEAVDFSEASNLKVIKNGAFLNNKLKNIIFGDNKSIIKIEGSAFENNLISGTVDFSETKISSIGDDAFYGNSIENVLFSNNITHIGKSVFARNSITNGVYPPTVVAYYDAFSSNPLKSLTFSGNTKYIASYGWCYNSLENLTLSNTTKVITYGAFADSSIKKVVIPKSVTYLGSYAFNYNKNLESVEYNSSADILRSTFAYCNKLKSLKINGSLKNIGEYAFQGNYTYEGSLDELVIPDSVESIGYGAFQNIKTRKIVIGNGVKEIGGYAFSDSGATSIKLGNSVETIKNAAFYDSNSSGILDDLVLPNSIKNIESMAFCMLSFKSVYIPSSIEYIDKYAFQNGTKPYTITIDKLEGSIFGAETGFGNQYVTVKYTKSLKDYINAGNNIPNGTAISFNPETGKLCGNEKIDDSYTNVKGCMRWFVFGDNGGSNINMILDHNISEDLAWNVSGKNISGPSTDFLNSLKTLTNGWTGVSNRSDSYSVNNGIANYTIDYTGYKARLLTANELVSIVGVQNYDVETNKNTYYIESGLPTASTNPYPKLEWIYANILGYGIPTDGYWLATAVGSTSDREWTVYSSLEQRRWSPSDADNFGIRPVITIPKSLIK